MAKAKREQSTALAKIPADPQEKDSAPGASGQTTKKEYKKRGWKFTNKLSKFGTEWLETIDKMIVQGASVSKIRETMLKDYRGPQKVPSYAVFASYVQWKKLSVDAPGSAAMRLQMETSKTTAELKLMADRLNFATFDIKDRKKVLENIIEFLLVRTQLISNVQYSMMDSRFEQTISNHLSLVKSTTEILLKLEGQLGMNEYVSRRILEMFMVEFAVGVRQAFEDTVGDAKTKAFIERVYKVYTKIDFERLRQDAILEANQQQTDSAVQAVVNTIKPKGK